MTYIRRLPHPWRGEYREALDWLRQDPDAVIAHIDSGVALHPALGWTERDAPPAWLLLDQGRDFGDCARAQDAAGPAWARLTALEGLDGLLEYPDHGVKTLSALCGTGRLEGVVPGAKVVPYRVSNGPLFRAGAGPAMRRAETARIGWALDHARTLPVPARVATISMGNPGFAGAFQPLLHLLGGEVGMARETAEAVDRAYEAGMIVCCAAGQVIESVIYPARWKRTIGVAGYDTMGSGGQARPYPRGGYPGNEDAEFVDIRAQAERVNRASFDLATGRMGWAEDFEQGEPSGTSYATPQAAGAAALWRSWHARELERMFGAEPWKIVEAFRHALKISASTLLLEPQGGDASRPWVEARTLDIPRLLATAPRADWPLEKRPPAAG